MSTTALLVEILIIGFEVTLWLILGLALLPGPRWILPLLGLDNRNAFLAAGALAAAAYVLGIVADKTAKWIVEESSLCCCFRFRSKNPAEQKVSPEKCASLGWMAAFLERLLRPYEAVTEDGGPKTDALEKYAQVVMKVGEPMSDLLYARSKVRILRASIFIVPLIILFAAANCMLALLRLPDESAPVLGTWTLPGWTGIVAVAVLGPAVALLLARYFNWLYCYNLQLYRDRLDDFCRRTRRCRPRGNPE